MGTLGQEIMLQMIENKDDNAQCNYAVAIWKNERDTEQKKWNNSLIYYKRQFFSLLLS